MEEALDTIMKWSQEYEMMHHISELVGAKECNYHFHPHMVLNSDVLIVMSVESDGKWVNQMVANKIPRFHFRQLQTTLI